MFELKISTDAAVTLITERMIAEYDARVKCGLLHADYELELLPYSVLLDIAETAALDLIFLLPFDVLMAQNNLSDIVVKSFRRLADIFNCEEFYTYTPSQARRLLNKTSKYFNFEPTNKFFEQN